MHGHDLLKIGFVIWFESYCLKNQLLCAILRFLKFKIFFAENIPSENSLRRKIIKI